MSRDASCRRSLTRPWRSAAAAGLLMLLALGPAAPAGRLHASAPGSPAVQAAAMPAPLQQSKWQAGWFLPPGESLPPDQERPPSVAGFFFRIDPPEGWIVTWSGEVKANGQTLPEEVAEVPGGRQLFYRLDPCALAGSDLPGTELTLSWDLVFLASHPQLAVNPPPATGSRVLRLGSDTAAPLIAYVPEPQTVRPGQTVSLEIGVLDDSAVSGPEPMWDAGLRYLGLTDLVSRQVHEPSGSQPKACAEKVTTATQAFDYSVPADAAPGQQLRLLAFAEDWSGNQAEREFWLLVADDEPPAEEPPAEEPPAEEPPAGPAGGPADQDPAGQDPTGGGAAPLFEPGPACLDARTTTMTFQGLNNRCSGYLSICGATLEIACPYTDFSALSVSETGPTICCERWQQALETGQPCDVRQDLDCDGIPNQQDTDPFRTGSPPPRRRGAMLPGLDGLLSLLQVPASVPASETCWLPWLEGR